MTDETAGGYYTLHVALPDGYGFFGKADGQVLLSGAQVATVTISLVKQ